MNILRTLSVAAGLAATAAGASAQNLAPSTNIANTVFTGTLTASTGGANGDGTFSEVFAANGVDYSLGADGGLTAPVAYTYASTEANAGTITETDNGNALSVALTFTDATDGTFVATYGSGSQTQSGTFTLNKIPYNPPLVNASNRDLLAPGGTAITGFVVQGGVPRTVLVRAVGPGLAQFGLTNNLATPQLQVWGSGSQGILGANAGWGSTAALQASFTQAGAFSLPAGGADSAIVLTLQPGAYTVLVSSTSPTDSGNVLMEVYFLN